MSKYKDGLSIELGEWGKNILAKNSESGAHDQCVTTEDVTYEAIRVVAEYILQNYPGERPITFPYIFEDSDKTVQYMIGISKKVSHKKSGRRGEQ